MNPDLASQLNSSKLSTADIQNLMKTLGQTSLGKKGSSLTSQDRNNLLSKMTSSTNSAEYMVEREDPTKNMTEEQKKQYHREELRRKLREKQGKFREIRSSKVNLQKKYAEQLNAMQNLNLPQIPTNTENLQNTQNVVVESKENKSKESSEEEQLEDFLN
jgi:seryl-tRNA synthetase